MDPNKIAQCSSCNRALIEGWVEMPDPLTEVWSRVCFSCGFKNLKIQAALHADDLLRTGMMEDGDASLLRD